MAAGKGKPSRGRHLLSRVMLVIAGLVLGLNLYRWNASALAGNALPMPFGTGAAVVLSGSMEPTLKVNDLILVRRSDAYRVGDMVVYQSGRQMIVHRIVSLEGSQVVTQGDANNVSDPPIEITVIKGKVAARIPAVGLVVNALKTPLGIVAVLAAAAAMTELSFRRERDQDEKELEAIKAEIRRLKEEQE